jgi:hypothetical protein
MATPFLGLLCSILVTCPEDILIALKLQTGKSWTSQFFLAIKITLDKMKTDLK